MLIFRLTPRAMLETLMRGVSIRQYKRVISEMADTMGVSKSSVSRQREREEVEHQAADEDVDRLRLAEEEAQRARGEWLRSWERYALDNIPYGLPPELRLQVHEAVRWRLGDLSPIPSEDVTRKLVSAEIDWFVARHWAEPAAERAAGISARIHDSLYSACEGWTTRERLTQCHWSLSASVAAAMNS